MKDKDKTKIGIVIKDSGISVQTDLSTVQRYIQKPASVITEIATGILASDKKDLVLSFGHLVQSGIKLRLLDQFFKELKNYQSKGKTKDDYWDITTNQASFVELMNYIDNSETPDETVFQAMKSIFFYSISKDSGEQSEILGYQYMKLCKELSSMDLLVLKACFQIYEEKPILDQIGHTSTDPELNPFVIYNKWILDISQSIANGTPTFLVIKSVEKLQNLGICIVPQYDNPKRIRPGHGLTDLGISIGDYISVYKTSTEK